MACKSFLMARGRSMFLAFAALAFAALSPMAAAQTTLQGITLQYPDAALQTVMVVISADAPFDRRTLRLAADAAAGKPNRYVLDAYDSEPRFYLDEAFERSLDPDYILSNVRVARRTFNNRRATRMVFDLKGDYSVSVTEQRTSSGGYQFILQFTPDGSFTSDAGAQNTAQVPTPTPAAAPNTANTATPAIAPRAQGLSTLITPEGVSQVDDADISALLGTTARGGAGDAEHIAQPVDPNNAPLVVSPAPASSLVAIPAVETAQAPQAPEPDPIPAPSRVPTLDREDAVLVVVDAGHGGRDPGAINNALNIFEKDITLSVARKLQRLLQDDPRFTGIMTRVGDTLPSLRRRVDITHERAADLFVSIHADAYPFSGDVKGASVYVLSDDGNAGELGRLLAQSANAVDERYGISAPASNDSNANFAARDLQTAATREASQRFGEIILDRLARSGRTMFNARDVLQAPFAVLKSSYTPSVLVEVGFLTNAEDARKMTENAEQERIARALFDAVEEYSRIYLNVQSLAPPPPAQARAVQPNQNQAAASQRASSGAQQYRVAASDTLFSISRKFNVSVATIRQNNNLRDNTIYVGQVLLIP